MWLLVRDYFPPLQTVYVFLSLTSDTGSNATNGLRILVFDSRLPSMFSTQRTPAPPALCNLIVLCISQGEVILVVILLRGNELYRPNKLYKLSSSVYIRG